MTYQETLNICRSNNIDGAKFYIAQEMEFQLEVDYSPERFEELCECVFNTYLKCENNNLWAICKAVADLEEEYQQGVEDKDPLEMNRYAILEKAGWYI